jgi:hypothetical protein
VDVLDLLQAERVHRRKLNGADFTFGALIAECVRTCFGPNAARKNGHKKKPPRLEKIAV